MTELYVSQLTSLFSNTIRCNVQWINNYSITDRTEQFPTKKSVEPAKTEIMWYAYDKVCRFQNFVLLERLTKKIMFCISV